MGIREFVAARLDEDESVIDTRDHDSGQCDYLRGIHLEPERALCEVAVKRRILTEVVEQIDDMDTQLEHEFGSGSGMRGESDLLLKLLALPYSDHPGYQPEWAPTRPASSAH